MTFYQLFSVSWETKVCVTSTFAREMLTLRFILRPSGVYSPHGR